MRRIYALQPDIQQAAQLNGFVEVLLVIWTLNLTRKLEMGWIALLLRYVRVHKCMLALLFATSSVVSNVLRKAGPPIVTM